MFCGKMSVVFVVSFRVRLIEFTNPQYYSKGELQLPREINKKCGRFLHINLTFQLVIQNKWQKVKTTSLFYFTPIN